MKMTPKISIIVPVYNTEPYIARCLDSILSQSFTDFELLLIDDGSTDGSTAICDSYATKDNRVRVFHKENGGVSSARNLGLDEAKGEWITFVDSDDWVEQGYFCDVVGNEACLVYRHRIFSDGTFDSILPKGLYKGQEFIDFFEENTYTNLFRMSNAMFFRRDVLQDSNIRFVEQLRFGEDRIFALQYYAHCTSVCVLDKAYYIYNRSEDWGRKYVISFSEAELFVDYFMKAYRQLPFQTVEIAELAGFCVKFIDGKEKHLRWKRAFSKPFLEYRRALLPNRPLGFRARYYFSKAVSIFVNV